MAAQNNYIKEKLDKKIASVGYIRIDETIYPITELKLRNT